MQGKVAESCELFQKEIKEYNLLFSKEDFKMMSSYLTFRYRTSPKDALSVLKEYKPFFSNFLNKMATAIKK